MKKDEEKLLGHLRATYKFRRDVDPELVMRIVEKTIRLDPSERSLDAVRDAVTELSHPRWRTHPQVSACCQKMKLIFS
jgi:hypothetical protein